MKSSGLLTKNIIEMYKTILNGGKYSLLVESKNENTTQLLMSAC
tara:strand:- start:149 stop:280 length:132 start_codon:yes stop_codon:yes gene_type:complete